MITNERQYRMAKSAYKRTKSVLFSLQMCTNTPSIVSQISTFQESIRTLEQDMMAYEQVKSGKYQENNATLQEMPMMLIRARIASGMTQKQLAEKLGIKEQQVQHYEATCYSHASFTRVCAVAEAINIQLFVEERKDAATSVCRP